MRKKIPAFFIVLCSWTFSFGQETFLNTDLQGLLSFSKSYFRSDPFTREFSAFLKHLINDPEIENKRIRKKTDTSLYLFSGRYKNYNPFFFKPNRVEVILQEVPLQLEDSLQATDTVFIYQLLAFTGNTEKNIKEVKKEFEKIHRQTAKKFYETKYDEEKKGDELIGELNHYFLSLYWFSPLSVSWGKLEDKPETVLALTLRFKMESNEPVLIGSLLNK